MNAHLHVKVLRVTLDGIARQIERLTNEVDVTTPRIQPENLGLAFGKTIEASKTRQGAVERHRLCDKLASLGFDSGSARRVPLIYVNA